jgi:hypothetical protein
MEQRRLRLGDILDDYCPRERRVTNHAVVAMIEDDVKQTRCTTCDAEHPYKGGQVPKRRRKETPAALYKEVLAGKSENEVPEIQVSELTEPEFEAVAPAAADDDLQHDPEIESQPIPEEVIAAEVRDDAGPAEDGPVHRPLIRATLPRPEGQKDARPLPEFTVRQPGVRGNQGNAQFRGNMRTKSRGGGHGGNGHRPQGGARFPGARPGQNRGQGGGFRSPQQPRHGGRKRSR